MANLDGAFKKTKAFFKSSFVQVLFAGLIPSLIAVFFIIQGLSQTKEQIGFLQEQISYVRKPVLVVSYIPGNITNTNPRGKLTISNVGNEPAENVYVKFHLMLVSDTNILSFGQRLHVRSYFVDTTRSPREMLWPRLTIYPDSQELGLNNQLYLALVYAYRYFPDSLAPRIDLINLRKKLGGIYVLFVESSYRKQSDLVLFADSSFFQFEPLSWYFEPLQDRIGGPAIQERVKSYLFNGPQISVNVYKDKYKIFRHHINFPEVGPKDIQVIKK